MVTRKSGAGGHGPVLPDDSEVLLEFHRLGNAVKVTAVDPRSLAEATIIGDPAVGERTLGQVAIRKLRYILQRRAAAGEEGSRSGGSGRGTLV